MVLYAKQQYSSTEAKAKRKENAKAMGPPKQTKASSPARYTQQQNGESCSEPNWSLIYKLFWDITKSHTINHTLSRLASSLDRSHHFFRFGLFIIGRLYFLVG